MQVLHGILDTATARFKTDDGIYDVIAQGVCEKTGREVILLASPSDSFGGSVGKEGEQVLITQDLQPAEWSYLNGLMMAGFDDFAEQEQAIFNLK